MRIQTVAAGDGPREYTYTLSQDVSAVAREDGGADLVAADPATGVAAVIGEVAPPWAVDAAGNPVETSYRFDDGRIIQVIVPGDQTQFPVVADPGIALKPFAMVADNPHISSTAPRAVSVHGWWEDGGNFKGRKAVITVYLQMKIGPIWYTQATGTKTSYAGSGSAKRAAARRECRGSSPRSWRAVVDVDIIGATRPRST